MLALIAPKVRSLWIKPFYHHGDLQSVRDVLFLFLLNFTIRKCTVILAVSDTPGKVRDSSFTPDVSHVCSHAARSNMP